MTTTVILGGELGRRFPKEWELECSSVAEASRIISVNIPEYKRYLIEHSEPGFHVLVGKRKLGEQELFNPLGAQVIRIYPAIAGAKSGGLLVIAGIALAAFSYGVLSPYAAGLAASGSAYAGIAGYAATAVGAIGTSLALSGVSQLLFRPPKPPGPQERPENKPSFVFNGPVNTLAQGQAVPVCFGELIVGGAIISQGISTEEIPV